jgi:hypothetical protein
VQSKVKQLLDETSKQSVNKSKSVDKSMSVDQSMQIDKAVDKSMSVDKSTDKPAGKAKQKMPKYNGNFVRADLNKKYKEKVYKF